MRWLHLSDLHVGNSNSSQKTALKDLVKAVESFADNRTLDIILLTGDLAYSGLEDEYKNLESLIINPLRNLSIAKNATIIAVPGNHDLNCDISHPLSWKVLGKRRQEEFFEDT